MLANEKKNRKKGYFTSAMIHTAAIVLALIPFAISQDEEPTQEDILFVAMEFSDFDGGMASASTKPVEQIEEKKEEAPVEEVEAPIEPVEVVSEPEPTPEPTPEPVVESKTVKKIVTTEVAETKVKVAEEKAKVEKKVTPKAAPKRKVVNANAKKASTKKVGTAAKKGTPSKSKAGEGKTGKATTGKAEKGEDKMDFNGDGLLSRKVTYRAPVARMSKESGKIVVNICVNPDGKVIYTEYNKTESTIKKVDLALEAQMYARQYRFEKDYKAPPKQCGKLTFIFELGQLKKVAQ